MKEFRKKRWEEDRKFTNFRGCWSKRIQRWFPNSNIKIPAIDEIVSHKILRYFALGDLLIERRKYYKSKKTYEGIKWFNKSWDKEIHLINEKVIIRWDGIEKELFLPLAIPLPSRFKKRLSN